MKALVTAQAVLLSVIGLLQQRWTIMAMNKVKSPFVKVLRKAGYSVKEAMNITLDAQYNFHNTRRSSRKCFNHLATRGRVGGMFRWDATPEGLYYWNDVQYALNNI